MSGDQALERVSAILERVLTHDSRPVMLRDMQSWKLARIPAFVAASPEGLLPALLVAAQAVWREASGSGAAGTGAAGTGAAGTGFGLKIEAAPQALLGYKAAAIGTMPFSIVMLSLMEALDQVARPSMFAAHELARVNDGVTARMARFSRHSMAEAAQTVTAGSIVSQEASSSPGPG
jgi:hypothetical protein